ncbi:hypothetical protein D3C73_974940 [compost metagenome]
MGGDDSGQSYLLIAQHLKPVIAFFPGGMNALNLMDIHRDLQLFQLFSQLFITNRLLGLVLERPDLILQLTNQIMNTQQILLRLIQFASGVFFT